MGQGSPQSVFTFPLIHAISSHASSAVARIGQTELGVVHRRTSYEIGKLFKEREEFIIKGPVWQ